MNLTLPLAPTITVVTLLLGFAVGYGKLDEEVDRNKDVNSAQWTQIGKLADRIDRECKQ